LWEPKRPISSTPKQTSLEDAGHLQDGDGARRRVDGALGDVVAVVVGAREDVLLVA